MTLPCRCSPANAGTTECSWTRFVSALPPTDPTRLRDEAGDDTLDWAHPDWTGEGCRCECHDGEGG